MYYDAPTYNIDTKIWSYTTFSTKKEYRDYVDNQFKYPSEYNLKYTNGYWNEQGQIFQKTKRYPVFPLKSLDYKRHWDNEKEKCNFEGIIIYKCPSENVEFAIPGMMYWYLNYCPIFDKRKKRNDLPQIYDGDYHYFLYLLRCVLHRKYGCVLKKRQSGYTLKNMAIIALRIWFGDSATCKIFAIDESAVIDSWGLMETYKQHLNTHTAWKRGFAPDKVLDWQIRTKTNDGGTVGNLSKVKGFTTKMDASKGVGGNIDILFGEEAGKNPTLDKTHGFVTSNVGIGGLTTGLIIYSGAVGELDKCDPLKKYVLFPEENNFLSCSNLIEDDADFGQRVGFFAPEWWNYVDVDEETAEEIECFDEWGNTDKEQALRMIDSRRTQAERASAEDYRYYCSQRPLSIKEAFDYRKDSVFPQALLKRQDYRIDKGMYPYTCHDIFRNADGKVQLKSNTYPEIIDFPYSPKKGFTPYGCIKIWEMPKEKAPFGTYFAAVDPIYVDKTTTSESLFSIVIYKNLVEIKYTDDDGTEKIKLEGDRIVASYIGRKEDVAKTNELGELLIELYNAFAVVENNVDNFIKHMISKHKQKYVATKSDLPFLKELETNKESYQEYGVRTNDTMWTRYVNIIREYLKEEIGVEHMTDGKELRKVYGVEKIPDKRLVKELTVFTDHKGNYDQVVTLGLVLCLAKSRQVNGLITKVNETKEIKINKNLYNTSRTVFKNLGTTNTLNQKVYRQPYRNLK